MFKCPSDLDSKYSIDCHVSDVWFLSDSMIKWVGFIANKLCLMDLHGCVLVLQPFVEDFFIGYIQPLKKTKWTQIHTMNPSSWKLFHSSFTLYIHFTAFMRIQMSTSFIRFWKDLAIQKWIHQLKHFCYTVSQVSQPIYRRSISERQKKISFICILYSND